MKFYLYIFNNVLHIVMEDVPNNYKLPFTATNGVSIRFFRGDESSTSRFLSFSSGLGSTAKTNSVTSKTIKSRIRKYIKALVEWNDSFKEN